MQQTEYIVRVSDHGREIRAKSGMNLLETLTTNGVFVRSDCGGKGTCGKCRVEISDDNGRSDSVKSCMYEVENDIFLRVPETSEMTFHMMTKAPVKLPEALKERLDTKKGENIYGIAVDLGTTTIAVYLCNMARGELVSSLTLKNPQAIYGDDVISRIGAINVDKEKLLYMQRLAVKGIEWGIKKLLTSFNVDGEIISGMVVVGNPTMIHIFAGVDPVSIGMSPYQPAFYEAASFQSGRLGFGMHDFIVRTLPQVSGFIGGDTLSAALAVDFEKQPDGTLLIDLGTNGELLLRHSNHLYAASCATGPAFEGASLSCGVQAIPGAVHAIEIRDKEDFPLVSLINPSDSDKIKPCGICGAGIINAVARLFEKRIIDSKGAFSSGKKKYHIFPKNQSSGAPSIYISQKDIRSVQLGKAALITGIESLLKKAGIEKPLKIIIAGALGSHVDTEDMILLGMIPDIAPEKIEIAGNAAGSGAIMALCSSHYQKKAAQMADRLETLELASDPEFQTMFIRNLAFS